MKRPQFDPGLLLLRRAVVVLGATACSFFTVLLATGLLATGPLGVASSVAVLAAALAVSFGRAAGRHRHGGAARVGMIAGVGIAASGVAWLFEYAFPVGAAVFVVGMSLAVYARRWGPDARRLGSLLSLPLVSVLVVPVALPRSTPLLVAVGLSVGAAVVAVLWVDGWMWAARATGFVRAGAGEASTERSEGMDASRRTPSKTAEPGERTRSGRGDSAPTSASSPSRRRLAASTRMSLQLATALTAAFIAGRLLFPDHWGWVVVTAYIVCAGNRGRGDVVYKSVLRVVGAVVGTVAVVFLTGLVGQGSGPAVAAVVFAVLLVALWLRDVNYAFWAAGVTVTLALLQGAAGAGAAGAGTGPGVVLGERIVAIVVGALCGLLASWFILPVRTEGVVRKRLADALAEVTVAVHPDSSAHDRLDAVRRFEAQLAEVEQVAKVVRVERRVTGRLRRGIHLVELVDEVQGLRPLVSRLVEDVAGPAEVASFGHSAWGRAELARATRAVGETRRSLRVQGGTDASVAAARELHDVLAGRRE